MSLVDKFLLFSLFYTGVEVIEEDISVITDLQ